MPRGVLQGAGGDVGRAGEHALLSAGPLQSQRKGEHRVKRRGSGVPRIKRGEVPDADHQDPGAEARGSSGSVETGSVAALGRGAGGGFTGRSAAQMQAAAMQPSTAGNYERHWSMFVDFCGVEGRDWMPATEATILLYVAFMLQKATVKGSSFPATIPLLGHQQLPRGLQLPQASELNVVDPYTKPVSLTKGSEKYFD
ncbi:hypothetical protein CYMTET_36955 [Cymbomonas tetramitiformis]|uniref:Uncharacterized protein n=1 Tax=Cymbomonas tetramitiformis TaxID=36881 RepID=A0AAE0F6G9_9CHLO|nr:hypothetical protein CYMTET_36955 [Cymbomonas tetramitiformis]